jgi:hypothetical protein
MASRLLPLRSATSTAIGRGYGRSSRRLLSACQELAHLGQPPFVERPRQTHVVEDGARGVYARVTPVKLPGVAVVQAEAEDPVIELQHRSFRTVEVERAVEYVPNRRALSRDRPRSLPSRRVRSPVRLAGMAYGWRHVLQSRAVRSEGA